MQQIFSTNKKSKYFLLSLLVCASLTPSYGMEKFNLGKRGRSNSIRSDVSEDTQVQIALIESKNLLAQASNADEEDLRKIAELEAPSKRQKTGEETENDSAIAWLIQQQLEQEGAEEEEKRRHEDIGDDLAIAKAQQELEDSPASRFRLIEPATLGDQEKASLRNLRDTLKQIVAEADVHRFTRNLGGIFPNIRKLSEITDPGLWNRACANVNNVDNLNTIRKLINSAEGAHDSAEKMLLKIGKEYWGDIVEPETGQNIKQLIAFIIELTRHDNAEYSGILRLNLADNLDTQGGCLAGVNGRLILLIGNIISRKFSPENPM